MYHSTPTLPIKQSTNTNLINSYPSPTSSSPLSSTSSPTSSRYLSTSATSNPPTSNPPTSKPFSWKDRRMPTSKPPHSTGRRKIQYFPSLPLKFLTFRRKSSSYHYHTAVFACLPRMTKHEIASYLVSCYGLPKPFKVNTAVMHGKGRRVSGKREVVSVKGREWKKAFVMWKEEDVMPGGEGEGA